MDALAALRLQIAWGADEALDDAPLDRTLPAPTRAPGVPARPGPAADAPGPAILRPPGPAGPQDAPQRPADRPPVGPAPAMPLATPAAQAQAAADAADTVEALRDALAAFTACPLRDTAGHLVFSDGRAQSGLVLVGEVPGPEEDRAGVPFAGPPGQLLDRMFASIGLDRTGFAIAMLVPWRPPGGRPPTDGEIATCLPFLHRHLALLRPRMIVPLGGLATRAVTGNPLGIRRLRGRPTESVVPGLERPVPALPMLHPAHLLRTPGAKREAWADLLVLRQMLDSITKT